MRVIALILVIMRFLPGKKTSQFWPISSPYSFASCCSQQCLETQFLSSEYSMESYQQPGMTPTSRRHSIPYLFSHHLVNTNHLFNLPNLMSLSILPVTILTSEEPCCSIVITHDTERPHVDDKTMGVIISGARFLVILAICTLPVMVWHPQSTLSANGLLPMHILNHSPPVRIW